MTEERSTLRAIADQLAGAVAPLSLILSDETAFSMVMWRLGWKVEGLPPGYITIADAAAGAVQAVRGLAANADAAAILAAVEQLGAIYQALGALDEAPAGIDPTEFLPAIGLRLFEYLLAEQLLRRRPVAYNLLEAIGVIRHEDVPSSETRPAFVLTRFDWKIIPEVLSDPASIPMRVFGWGTGDIDFQKFVVVFSELALALGLPSSIDRESSDFSTAFQSQATGAPAAPIRLGFTVPFFDMLVAGQYEEVGFTINELPAEGPALPGFVLRPKVPQGLAVEQPLGGGWSFRLRAGTEIGDAFGLVLRPGEIAVRYPFAPGQSFPDSGFGAAITYDGQAPALLFGEPGATRLELAKASFSADIVFSNGELELKTAVEPKDLALVVAPGGLDGFLASLLGGEEVTVAFPFSLSWSNRTGLDFTSGAGFEASLYPHLDLGLIRFDRIDLGVRFSAGAGATPELAVHAAAALSGSLGPIGYSVDRLGVELPVVFEDGNAGPFNLDFQVLRPTGLGLLIDSGVVAGGGFVSFDAERGRYCGIIGMRMFAIDVSAIAILDTRDAAGSALPPPGFSLLMSILSEFPPIQLGYGFTLNGVGGVVAIHRRMNIEAFRSGLRDGVLDAILFPDDPVENASTILGNLAEVFPVATGRHVFGPMAILGWGTPTLLTVELGVLLEVPEPVLLALVGQASVAIPSRELRIVSINVDVLGVVDFGRKLFSVDATLRDSYIALYALQGDMAMRLAWGAAPNFALAVGGLNPGFTPPAGFPTLRRLTVALGVGENPRISLEGYFALTSNSLQFGARAELYAEAGGFNVNGWVGFDALLIYAPLSFRVDFTAGMTLNRGAERIGAITIVGHLTGPSPFHAWGEGRLSVLFLDVTVPFDATFGDRQDNELPPRDPWPALSAAILQNANWHSELPPGVVGGVALRSTADLSGQIFVQPMGAATLRQKILPLNRRLERFGQFEIVGADRYDVVGVKIGGTQAATWATTEEHFAPGDFEDLGEAEKLSRDSFEPMDAGVSVGGDAVDAPEPEMKIAPLVYETTIIDTPWGGRSAPAAGIDRGLHISSAGRGAKAGGPMARTGAAKFSPLRPRQMAVALAPERYALATLDALATIGASTAGGTKGAASLALKQAGGRARFQIVPAFELGNAA